jgi:hypothetical protein
MLLAFLKNLVGIEKNEWQKFLKGLGREARSDFNFLVNNFFIPDKIEFVKFSANFHAVINDSAELYSLYAQFDEVEKELSNNITKSMQGMDLLGGVPLGYPNWFVAAYPDVMLWATKAADASDSDSILFKAFGIEKTEDFENLQLLDNQKHFKNEFLRKLVDFYLRTTNLTLECSK